MTVFGVTTLAVCAFFLWTANPVHGVLSLVVVGLTFAGVLLVHSLEFLGLLLVLVYVGAVTVLFIFVVMMVNLRVTPSSYITVEGWIVWIVLVGSFQGGGPILSGAAHAPGVASLGWSLYGTERLTGVLLVGLILFVAMVAAICLSLVGGENYRTQEVYSQVRKPNVVFTFATRTGVLLPVDEVWPLLLGGLVILYLGQQLGGPSGPTGTPTGTPTGEPTPDGPEPRWKWWLYRVVLPAVAAATVIAGVWYFGGSGSGPGSPGLPPGSPGLPGLPPGSPGLPGSPSVSFADIEVAVATAMIAAGAAAATAVTEVAPLAGPTLEAVGVDQIHGDVTTCVKDIVASVAGELFTSGRFNFANDDKDEFCRLMVQSFDFNEFFQHNPVEATVASSPWEGVRVYYGQIHDLVYDRVRSETTNMVQEYVLAMDYSDPEYFDSEPEEFDDSEPEDDD